MANLQLATCTRRSCSSPRVKSLIGQESRTHAQLCACSAFFTLPVFPRLRDRCTAPLPCSVTLVPKRANFTLVAGHTNQSIKQNSLALQHHDKTTIDIAYLICRQWWRSPNPKRCYRGPFFLVGRWTSEVLGSMHMQRIHPRDTPSAVNCQSRICIIFYFEWSVRAGRRSESAS